MDTLWSLILGELLVRDTTSDRRLANYVCAALWNFSLHSLWACNCNCVFSCVFLVFAVAQLGSEDEGVCYAEISKEKIRTVRSNMPVEVPTRLSTFTVSNSCYWLTDSQETWAVQVNFTTTTLPLHYLYTTSTPTTTPYLYSAFILLLEYKDFICALCLVSVSYLPVGLSYEWVCGAWTPHTQLPLLLYWWLTSLLLPFMLVSLRYVDLYVHDFEWACSVGCWC